MIFTWDDAKNADNIANHKVDFRAVFLFDWDRATFRLDRRFDYGEDRIIAHGEINGRLHTLVYTMRGDVIRVISLWKSNSREKRNYDRKIKS